MKKLAPLLAVLFCLSSARADWVIVQKTTRDGGETAMTLKIKGDQARVDMGDAMSALMGAEGMTMIMHQQRVMMKMDAATVKQTMEAAAKLGGVQGGGPTAKPVATGQTEKVGEWDAEIYTWEGTMGKGRFWVAKNFPKFAEINAVSDKMGKAMGSPMSGMAPQASDFPGMVVKSEMTMMGKTIVTKLVSATEQDIDAKEFAAPEGYQEMKMPSLPGGAR